LRKSRSSLQLHLTKFCAFQCSLSSTELCHRVLVPEQHLVQSVSPLLDVLWKRTKQLFGALECSNRRYYYRRMSIGMYEHSQWLISVSCHMPILNTHTHFQDDSVYAIHALHHSILPLHRNTRQRRPKPNAHFPQIDRMRLSAFKYNCQISSSLLGIL